MKRLGYRRELDGLRGVAILMVMFVHVWRGLGGQLGVDLFLVLSGYLITSILLSEWRASGSVSLRSFYRRRAARLLPALLILLAAFLAATGAFIGVALAASYGTNFIYLFDRGALPVGLQHLWSLALEEQFYLLWPALLVLGLRRGISSCKIARAAIFLGVLAAISAGMTFQHLEFWMRPDAHAFALLVGCATALRPRDVGGWRAVGAAVIAVLAIVWFRNGAPAIGLPLFAWSCSRLLLHALQPGLLARALSSRPLVGLGRISYGVYLWHVPLLGAAAAWIAIPAAIVIATLSWLLVEQPIIAAVRQGEWRRARAERPSMDTANAVA